MQAQPCSIFSCLLHHIYSLQGSIVEAPTCTLLHLRNLINWRNVSKDVSGHFNAALDLFQLVMDCHIITATLHYFGMKDIKDTPVFNVLPFSIHQQPLAKQWNIFSDTLGCLVDWYVIVHRFTDLHPEPSVSRPLTVATLEAIQCNPHALRVKREHSYDVANLSEKLLTSIPYQCGFGVCQTAPLSLIA